MHFTLLPVPFVDHCLIGGVDKHATTLAHIIFPLPHEEVPVDVFELNFVVTGQTLVLNGIIYE